MLFEDDGSDDDLRASRQSHVKGNTRVRPATAKPSVPAPQLSQSPTHRARKHQPVPVSAQSTQQSQSLPQQNSSVDESDPLQSAARVLASVQRSSVRNSVTTIPQPFTFLARDNPQGIIHFFISIFLLQNVSDFLILQLSTRKRPSNKRNSRNGWPRRKQLRSAS
jgi:hypothetical protein